MMVNVKYILAALAIIGMSIVAILVLWPDSSAAKEISEWIPGTEINYVAEVEYTVYSGTFIWESMNIKIDDVKLIEKVTYLSIGGFAFWPETHRGVIEIESIWIESGKVVDKVVRDVDVSEGWFGWEESKTLKNQVILGKEGSGEYKILITLWDKEGEKIDEDYSYRTI